MFKALELTHFKAFGEPASVPLAPITLVFGENSAGKTSLLQVLTLLKQTLESRGRDPGVCLLPRAEEGLVDLGSFSELLFDHDSSNPLRISITAGLQGLFEEARNQEQPPPVHFTLGWEFSQSSPTKDVKLARLTFATSGNELPSASYVVKRAPRNLAPEMIHLWRRRRQMERVSALRDTFYVAECESLSDDKEAWVPTYRAWYGKREQIVEMLDQQSRPLPNRLSSNPSKAKSSAVIDALKFYSSDFSLESFIDRITRHAIGQVIPIDGFLPFGEVRGNNNLAEADLWFRRMSWQQMDVPPPSPSMLLMPASFVIGEKLRRLFPLGPFRRPPSRWYMYSGSSPKDVGLDGGQLPDLLLRKHKLRREVDHWLDRLGVGYNVKIKRVGGIKSDLFSLRLVDKRRGTPVNVALTDVGFGLSQILPFVVQCLASQNRIISIEQPEVHVHPKLQAELGDLIAAAIRKPYGHQFLIETHSEHLLLRIQKLVRTKQLKPEEVSIIYVMRGEGGSRVQRLRLTDDGRLLDEWPGGFFPERLKELL
jgi:hypothetical protein